MRRRSHDRVGPSERLRLGRSDNAGHCCSISEQCRRYPNLIECLSHHIVRATECATGTLAAFGGEMVHESTFQGVIDSIEDHGWQLKDLVPGQGETVRSFVRENPTGDAILLTRGHVMALRNGLLTDTTEMGPDGRELLAWAEFERN